ncbi:hypothetical protein C6990_09690 [Nitrosopumilus sp. b3]|uniref:hypothetical protein n=1 Tax=Nitrosopumilus sp. b3 TaxID=2109909 RepID=UPI0015F7007E|nr:hypothetical protein [Nitrosopumilus sp. b3]KAF6246385.1 hypothetical protein C6990_09690 [Nitrosopumilus sp. b3]
MAKKRYKQHRVLAVLEQLGFKILNPNSDAPVFYLQHRQDRSSIVSIDRYEQDFLEDYLEAKFEPDLIDFTIFKYLYDKSKEKDIRKNSKK